MRVRHISIARRYTYWHSNPRRYEPRCGARFVDLDHGLPPLDHPEVPSYRQRQPARENLPNPTPRTTLPQQADALSTLSNWPHAEIVLSCKTCGLRDVLNVALRRQALPGGDEQLAYLRYNPTIDYPKRHARSVYEQFGAVFEEPSN